MHLEEDAPGYDYARIDPPLSKLLPKPLQCRLAVQSLHV
jgi:hypothetical protein